MSSVIVYRRKHLRVKLVKDDATVTKLFNGRKRAHGLPSVNAYYEYPDDEYPKDMGLMVFPLKDAGVSHHDLVAHECVHAAFCRARKRHPSLAAVSDEVEESIAAMTGELTAKIVQLLKGKKVID